MSESYSQTEVDAKLQTVEERINHKFTILLHGFERVDKDIAWLSKITLATFGLMISILLGAAIKLLFFH